jgi:phosphate transport system substrate-binding protein
LGGGALALVLSGGALYWAAHRTVIHAPHPPVPGAPAASDLRLQASNPSDIALAAALAQAWMKARGASAVGAAGAADGVLVQGQLNGKPLRIAIGGSDRDAPIAIVRGPGSDGRQVLAIDGLAVVTSADNAIPGLSREAVGRLAAGQVSNWSEVGGPDRTLTVYAPAAGSSAERMLNDLGFKGSAGRPGDGQAVTQAVLREPDAVGFVSLADAKAAHALPINDGLSLPTTPDIDAVKTEAYPLSQRVYIQARSPQPDANTQAFIAFALSSAGQKTVSAAGLADLEPSRIAPSAEGDQQRCRLSYHFAGSPLAYCRLKSSAARLSMVFRFVGDSGALDDLSVQDLTRVRDAVKGAAAGSVILAGFAETDASYEVDCQLSQDRATAVADRLKALGVAVESVQGFCRELPVRDGQTAEGRAMNTRVEVFVR